MKTPLIIAHRGASFDAPENTMASINLAWQQNTDAIEVDVHKTRDNKIVVMHDPDTLRTTGIRKIIKNENSVVIRQLDAGIWKGAKWKYEYIPFLNDIIETVAPGKKIFIEIKGGQSCIDPLKDIIQHSNLKPEQVTLMDFDADVLKQARQVFPQYEILWLYEFIPPLNDLTAAPVFNAIIKQALQMQMDGINIELNPYITTDLIKKTQGSGLKFYTWTVNDSKTAEFMASAGIDGMTTDRPAFLKDNLRNHSPGNSS